MSTLNRLLDYLENNIDEGHIERTELLHLDAMGYRSVPYLPVTLIYPPDDVQTYPYEEAFFDPEKMLYNELIGTVGGASAYNSARLKDDFPMHVRSNHGIGILSSLFGAHCKIINNNMPWVEHMELDDLGKSVGRGVPELYQELGMRVIDTLNYFAEKLKGYPKCSRCIRVTQPDLQGPFDIAHLLIGDQIFYGVYDFPELLHELLGVITDTYIAFRRKIQPLLTDSAGDQAVYVHGAIYGGKVLLKDDTAIVNLSEEMYRDFSKRYNDQIFEAFGGGSMHYCGPSREWTHDAISSPWLRAVNYGNPEQQNLAELNAFWIDKKVPNLMWGDALCGQRQDYGFLEEIHSLGIRSGISLAIRVNDYAEAQDVLDKHRNLSRE